MFTKLIGCAPIVIAEYTSRISHQRRANGTCKTGGVRCLQHPINDCIVTERGSAISSTLSCFSCSPNPAAGWMRHQCAGPKVPIESLQLSAILPIFPTPAAYGMMDLGVGTLLPKLLLVRRYI
jgi:hypothetical protein